MINELLESLAVLVERRRPTPAARKRAAMRQQNPALVAAEKRRAEIQKRRTAAQTKAQGKVLGSRGTPVDPLRRAQAQRAAKSPKTKALMRAAARARRNREGGTQ